MKLIRTIILLLIGFSLGQWFSQPKLIDGGSLPPKTIEYCERFTEVNKKKNTFDKSYVYKAYIGNVNIRKTSIGFLYHSKTPFSSQITLFEDSEEITFSNHQSNKDISDYNRLVFKELIYDQKDKADFKDKEFLLCGYKTKNNSFRFDPRSLLVISSESIKAQQENLKILDEALEQSEKEHNTPPLFRDIRGHQYIPE